MRGSDYVFIGGLLLTVPFLASTWDLAQRQTEAAQNRVQTQALVRSLELTDLCLSTEARYTRHLSQADRHAAFQDHPVALEHFPSGSLLLPRKDRIFQ